MKKQLLIGLGLALLASSAAHAQTAPPPTMGQETKGEPAQPEVDVVSEDDAALSNTTTATDSNISAKRAGGAFGTTKIKESRRENGQVYRIELQHSSGRNQYIEETDSDGNIESEPSDIEDTPNLAKWRIGSW